MKILLLFFFCFPIKFSFAASMPSRYLEDTASQKGPNQLNQDEFLEKYGRDDSSKALIDFFFHKRNIGIPDVSIGAPLLIGGAIGMGTVVHTVNENKGTWDTFGQAILFIILLGAGAALFSVGAGLCSRYSRKRLLRLLNNYFDGKSLPRGIAKSGRFKKLLGHER